MKSTTKVGMLMAATMSIFANMPPALTSAVEMSRRLPRRQRFTFENSNKEIADWNAKIDERNAAKRKAKKYKPQR